MDTINRRGFDTSALRQGMLLLIEELEAILKRSTPEQIAKSPMLSKRQLRLKFLRMTLDSFVAGEQNARRKSKRKTYLIGVCCPVCAYTVRVTRRWLSVAMLTCPDRQCLHFGKPMEELGEAAAAPQETEMTRAALLAIQEEYQAEQKAEDLSPEMRAFLEQSEKDFEDFRKGD